MPKQNVAFELFYDGSWHDVAATDDVFAEMPIRIQRGQGDESAAFRPAQAVAQLNNDDDRFRTSNPMSPLYGKAGRNTPLRVKVGGVIRAACEASSWAPDQTTDFRQSPPRGKAWVDLEAGGLLRRVAQWTVPLKSPLRRFVDLSGTKPAEYWPMEDPNGSSFASSVVGGAPMKPITTVRYTLPDGTPLAPGGSPDFARGAGIDGSASLPNFQGGGTLRSPVRVTTFNGYAIDWVMQFQAGTDKGGTTSADVFSWRESGTYVHYTVNVIKGFVTVFHANATDDATLASTGSAVAALDVYDGAAHHFRYQVRQNGGNYLAQLYIDGFLKATADNFTPGMTGTVGTPTQIEWNPGEDKGDYMPVAAGHVIVWASGQIGDQPAVFNALAGHAGELTGDRITRLLDEHGIPLVIRGDLNSGAPMGPQPIDTLPKLLEEIVRTEDGLLFDEIASLVLVFTQSDYRYNQTPSLTLTPTDMPALPKEVTDDLGVSNIVTARMRSGAEYTVRDDTSPLGTQAPPNGVGEYTRTVDVNLDDENLLPQYANWWMRRGTVDRPRFPQITVDLTAASPGLISAVESVDVGDVIEITGFREYTVRLYVLGYTETIGTHTRSITFTCAPDQQFQVGVYDDGVWRWDTRTTKLASSATSTAVSLSLTTTAKNDVLTTAGGSLPYDLLIEGERVRVTAMTAPAGSGPYTQTATVTRSINGVVKALPANSSVSLYDSRRWGL